jgi:hypothetical protein
MNDSEGDREVTPAWIAAAILLVAALGGAIAVGTWPLGAAGAEGPTEPRLIEPVDDGTLLWPYTARSKRHGARTLAINLVIRGDPDTVRDAMLNRSGPTWTETPPEMEAAEAETFAAEIAVGNGTDGAAELVFWSPARGSTRYAYLVDRGSGRWVTESYQIHDGTYFGRRTHVRAYEDPGGEWTAMQAHEEYWDWFRLRHTVTGVASAQRTVERDFMGAPFVDAVVRHPYHHGAPGGGNWMTVVHFSLLVAPGLVALRSERFGTVAADGFDRYGRELGLGLALFVLYLGVRSLGLGVERVWPGADPHLVAAPIYLLLVLGTPALASTLASGADPGGAFTGAVVWLGSAFVVDAVVMQVSALPLRFVLHRTAVLLAVGLIAYGGAQAADRDQHLPLIAGFLGWMLVLVPPALGYL